MPEIHAVAVLRTPFAEKFGVPRQSGLVPMAVGRLEFLPKFAAPEFVRGLAAFSHVWLVTGFHQNPPWDGSATVRPPRLGGNKRVGVFASRSPVRPNGLGLSLVRLLAVEPGVLVLGGVDCVDKTPVYDVKPYLPWCEALPEATADWAGDAPGVRDAEKIRVGASVVKDVPESTLALIRQLLALDLQPAYLVEDERVHGMTVAGWNVRWRRSGEEIEVIALEPSDSTHGSQGT